MIMIKILDEYYAATRTTNVKKRNISCLLCHYPILPDDDYYYLGITRRAHIACGDKARKDDRG